MPGRTLREAIAVALEPVPSVDLAAGDRLAHRLSHSYVVGWIKQFAYARGVIFKGNELNLALAELSAELRSNPNEEPESTPFAPVAALAVACTICNAKVDDRCTSLVNASKWLEVPHAARVELAQKGLP